jgi:hypothetical protein
MILKLFKALCFIFIQLWFNILHKQCRYMAKRRAKAARRSYGSRKTRKSGSRKFSAFRLVKGIAYGGAIALPAYNAYQQLGGGAAGATGAMKCAAFIDPATDKLSLAAGAQIWTPVAAVALVDFVTTKIPVQRVISRGLRNLF